MQLIKYPNKILKRRTNPVVKFDAELKELAHAMIDLMIKSRGVGLAAPQIGKSISLFVANPTGNPNDSIVYINPTVSPLNDEEIAFTEGCLSLPGINLNVVRPRNVGIIAQDLKGNVFSGSNGEFLGRIWQHEQDHLAGILLTDRMTFSERMKFKIK